MVKIDGWNISFYVVDTWTLRRVDRIYLESFEMWYWRRMEKKIWADRARNDEVLHTQNRERNILHTVNKEKTNWVVTTCVRTAFSKTLFKETLGRIEVTGRRERRNRQ
jgi:hypothetical protein